MKQSGWRYALKRTLDVTAASAGLALFAPVLGATALAVRATMGSPVLFRQERGGRHGKRFDIFKFRTMLDAQDASGRPRPDEERLTKLGRFLRATSIDELPGLVNVLRGEMSLVGPRPLMSRYLERYSPEQARRHEVIPGLTGWAQVNGRNALTWEERFALDVFYVDHWSLALDAEILLRTVATVLRPQEVSYAGHATMYEFQGTPSANPQPI